MKKQFLGEMQMPPFLKKSKKPADAPAADADEDADGDFPADEPDADSDDAELDGALEAGNPDLADISDDDLVAEAKRRGMTIEPASDAPPAKKPAKKKPAEPMFGEDDESEDEDDSDF